MKTLINIQPRVTFESINYKEWQEEVDQCLNDGAHEFVGMTQEIFTPASGKIMSVPVAWFIREFVPTKKAKHGTK